MDLTTLHTFITVVDCGGITAAAQRLHCVQPAVTSRIKRLEDSLATKLFHRDNRTLRLSDAGERLVPLARRMLQLAEEIRDTVGVTGSPTLRLGAMESTAAARLPQVLAFMKAHDPGLRFHLTVGPSDFLVREVMTRRLDLALVGGQIDHPDLLSCPILTETLVEIWPQTPEAPATLLAFRQGCAYRARADAWLRHQHRAPVDIMEFGSLDAILGCVAAGLGFAVLPLAVAQQSSHDVQTRTIAPEFARIATCLLHRRDTPPPPLATALIRQLAASSTQHSP